MEREGFPFEQLSHYSPEQMAWEKVVNLPSDLQDFVNERIRFGFYKWSEVIKLSQNTIREHKQRVSTGVHEFGHWFTVSALGGINKRITAIPNLAADNLGVTEFSLASIGNPIDKLRKMIAIAYGGGSAAVVGGTDTGGTGSDMAQARYAAQVLSQQSGGHIRPEAYLAEGRATANKITSSIGRERFLSAAHHLVYQEAA